MYIKQKWQYHNRKISRQCTHLYTVSANRVQCSPVQIGLVYSNAIVSIIRKRKTQRQQLISLAFIPVSRNIDNNSIVMLRRHHHSAIKLMYTKYTYK